MKYIMPLSLLFAVSVAILGCQTDASATPSTQQEIDELMARWSTGMVDEDIDLMMSAYHEDAVLEFAGDPPLEGFSRIRQSQQDGMREGDWSVFVIERSAEPMVEGAERTYTVTVPGEVTLYNSFTYRESSAGTRIATQSVEVGPPIE